MPFKCPDQNFIALLYLIRYNKNMYNILQTDIFKKWLKKLKDMKGKSIILDRIKSAGRSDFGDCKPVGDNVSEMRIHFGPGYRLYFTLKNGILYILLCGGIKDTQKRDIAKAGKMAEQVQNTGEHNE